METQLTHEVGDGPVSQGQTRNRKQQQALHSTLWVCGGVAQLECRQRLWNRVLMCEGAAGLQSAVIKKLLPVKPSFFHSLAWLIRNLEAQRSYWRKQDSYLILTTHYHQNDVIKAEAKSPQKTIRYWWFG